ncbi:MAG TPA: hypothetical protein VNT56_00230 [Acidimicrobiales bacterium]|nr:hypothetical protein [Acidimicrobiales bacterium]
MLVAAAVVLGMTQLAAQPAFGVTFTNSTPITIPALGPTVPAPWPGSPYPSSISVTGLTGTITDVNVILNGFDCSETQPDFAYPEDVDLLLAGPTGANVVFLSDIGGNNLRTPPLQFSDLTITVDDEAAAPLPADTQLRAGTYRPLDDDDDPDEQVITDTWPAPAPAPSSATALSVFDGTAPNGTWNLWLADDFQGPDNCSLLRGWTIDITTTDTGGTTTTTAGPTTTTLPPTTTTLPPTTTTLPPTTTTLPPTTTTLPPTTTTTVPSGDVVGDIDEEVNTDGSRGQVVVTITCDAGSLFLLRVEITQGAASAQGTARGTCTGSPQEVKVGFATARPRPASMPGSVTPAPGPSPTRTPLARTSPSCWTEPRSLPCRAEPAGVSKPRPVPRFRP